jgi:aminoglycoside phosphotransferase (APT) family kinase protein
MEFGPEPLASIDLSVEVAQAVVDRLDRGWKAMAVRPLAGGSKDVFEIELADAAPVVLKVYGDRAGFGLPKEAYVAGLIGDRLQVPTHRWLLTDETKALLPRRFALISKLDGAPMTSRSGTPQADGLYRQMGAALQSLRAVTLPSFGYIMGAGYLKAFDTNLDYMTAAFRVKFRDFAAQGGDPALIDRLQAKVQAGADAVAGCGQAVLCHNDIHPGNFLVAQDAGGVWRVSGLIDWENATAADPLFDLAKALDQILHDDPPGRDPLLAGYGDLGRPDAWAAIQVYRIYHKLEMRNWLVAKDGDASAPGPVNLLRDLEELAA